MAGLELPALVQRLVFDTSGFSEGLKAAQGQTGTLGSSFANVGKQAALAAAPLLLIGGAAFKAAEDVDVAQKKIEARTGATGKALEGLQQSWHNVAEHSAADFNTIAETMSGLYQRTQLTGVPLEKLTRQMLALNRVSKDGAPPINTLTGVMTQFNIPAAQMGVKLDQLFRISQKTGVGVSELSSVMQRVGPYAKAAGLSFGETATFIGKLNEAGVPAQAGAFALRTALKNAGEAGLTLRDYLGEAIPKIADLAAQGKISDATLMATQVFGGRGGTMVAAITSGKLSVEGLTHALGAQGATLLETAGKTKGLAQVMGEFKNRSELALAPLGEKLLPVVSGAFKFLGDHVDQVVPVVIAFGVAIATLKIGQLVSALIEMGTTIATKVVPALLAMARAHPVLLALTAAVTAGIAIWHAFSGANENAKKATENMTEAIEDQTSALDKNIAKVLEASFTSKHQNDDLARLGLSYKDVEKAITGSDKQFGAFMKKVVDSGQANLGLVANLQDQRKGFQDGAKGALELAEAHGVLSKKQADNLVATNTNKDGHVNWANVAEAVREKEKQLADAHDKTKQSAQDAAAAQQGLTTSTQGSGAQALIAAGTTAEFNAELDKTKKKAGDAGDAVEAFESVLDKALGRTINLTEAEIDLNASFDSTTEALKKTTGHLDLRTEAGRAATQGLDSEVSKAYEYIKAMNQQGKSTEEVTAFVGSYNLRLADQVTHSGLAADEQQRLIDKYKLTPEQISTLVTLENAGANAGMDETLAKANALKQSNPTITVSAETLAANQALEAVRQKILALHPTENKNGVGWQIPLGGGLRGFASGGEVMAGHPIVVGERGPELFVPAANGTIIPNGSFASAAAPTVAPVITINVDGAADARTVSAMKAMLDGTVRDLAAAIKAGVA